MRLTVHRGTHEIGGSCVELQSGATKLLIDLGMPLDFDKRPQEEQNRIRVQTAEWCTDVDALFLSHAHADHYGFLDLLPDGLPLYASQETCAMLSLDAMFGADPCERLTPHVLVSGRSVEVGDFRITPYTVDHSAFGACAFLFEAEGKRILYSGDIRLHGIKGILYKSLPQEVDGMLMEGTNIATDKTNPSEREIERRFTDMFDAAPEALHLVWASAKNIDRICALFRACKRRGKTLVVDPYAANVLEAVARLNPKIPTVHTSPQLKVYFPSRITTLLSRRNRDRYIFALNPKRNKLTYEAISSDPARYVMLVRPTVLEFLRCLTAPHIRLVTSIWHNYWDDDKNLPFREWANKHTEIVPDIHTSGHADVASLRKVLAHVRPKTLFPVHSACPELFVKVFGQQSIRILQDNEPLNL